MKSPFKTENSRERITDWYLITILFFFPLFSGFSGYADITFAKYAFFLAATGLWLAGLAYCSLCSRRGPGRPNAAQAAALIFLALTVISWALSPWRWDSFLGAGRFDGLLSLLCYTLSFLGVSAYARPRRSHALAFAAGIFLCCAAGTLHLLGLDPLRLFPAGFGYYDSGTLYSGVYLGTIGNTNILDAVLCLALPLFTALYILGLGRLFLLPLAPACFCLVRAGGAGAAIALGAFPLLAGPLLLTDGARLRRGCRAVALVLFVCAVGGAFHPDYGNRILTLRLIPSIPALLIAAAAAALFLASVLRYPFPAPSGRILPVLFLSLDAAALTVLFLVLWFWPGETGAAYELKSALHGQLEDSFGSSRILIWRECLALVPARPLLGGGPGTLALRLNINFSRYVPETGETLTAFVDNAHNIYLGYLTNCGAAGLAAYLGLLLCAGKKAVGAAEQPYRAALALALLCAAIHGFFGLGLCISEPFFWIALGLLCSDEKEGTA